MTKGLPPAGAAPAATDDAALPRRATAKATDDRAALEAAWLTLARDTLPALAAARGWPVSADHCFQRILLDNACGGRWYDHIAARPAYRHAPAEVLTKAVALGEAVAGGAADLHALDARSLAWRGKRRASPPTSSG